PVEKYPHNVLLEIALDTGVIGALVFVVTVGAGLHRMGGLALARRGRDSARAALIASLLVFALVNGMVSSGIAGNGGIWLALGLGAGLGAGAATRSARVRAARRRTPPARSVLPSA